MRVFFLITLCSVLSCSVVSNSLQLHGMWPAKAPLPMEFSRQEYWSGLPFPIPGDLPNPRIEPKTSVSAVLQADSLLLEPPGKPLLLLHLFKNFI